MIFANIVLAILLILASKEDIDGRRIPNRLIIAGLYAFVALTAWLIYHRRLTALYGCLLAGSLAFVLYLIPYIAGVMGAGDVKLALVTGLLLGWEDWLGYLAVFCAVSILVSAAALLIRRKKATALPLAPVMAAAYFLSLIARGRS